MSTYLQLGIILLILNNFAMLGTHRLPSLIKLVTAQGILLSLLLLIPGPRGIHLHAIILSLAILAIKGICLPKLLFSTFHKVEVDTFLSPHISYAMSVGAGILGLIFSLWLEAQLLPSISPFFPPLLIPAALTTLFSGLILVVGRTRAITQVIGYLAAENGIFLLGIPMMSSGSTWFELTILLDVLAAVFVMGIAINHINATFESINIGRFCSLHD